MSSLERSMERQIKKKKGTLIHKKAIAKKLGCSVEELDKRLERRAANLREMEGK